MRGWGHARVASSSPRPKKPKSSRAASAHAYRSMICWARKAVMSPGQRSCRTHESHGEERDREGLSLRDRTCVARSHPRISPRAQFLQTSQKRPGGGPSFRPSTMHERKNLNDSRSIRTTSSRDQTSKQADDRCHGRAACPAAPRCGPTAIVQQPVAQLPRPARPGQTRACN